MHCFLLWRSIHRQGKELCQRGCCDVWYHFLKVLFCSAFSGLSRQKCLRFMHQTPAFPFSVLGRQCTGGIEHLSRFTTSHFSCFPPNKIDGNTQETVAIGCFIFYMTTVLFPIQMSMAVLLTSKTNITSRPPKTKTVMEIVLCRI